MSDRESCVERGHAVLVSLAHRFPQLYVAPGDDAGEAHRLARLRGVVPPNANLDHFHGSADDELRVVSTPAGPVEVVFLKERADFETFLQVVGHKSAPVPIARTVGAITYRGLADWSEIAAAHERLAKKDFVHHSDRPRQVLRELLDVDPGNLPARNYLLCYDLMSYNLDGFMETYAADMIPGHVYNEAILIWLSQNGRLAPDQLSRYGVPASEVDRMGRFGRNPGAFKNTYWYYYLKAMNEQQ